MKLKKIASLMLAGVMAVSMLTACGEGASSSQPNQPDEPAVSGLSAKLGEAMDNAVINAKVNFVDSSSLDAALKHAMGDIGDNTVTAGVALPGDVQFAGLYIANLGLAEAYDTLEEDVDPTFGMVNTGVRATTDQIAPAVTGDNKYDQDGVNTILLFVVESGVMTDNIIEQIGVDVESSLEALVNGYAYGAAQNGNVNYKYDVSVAADSKTFAAATSTRGVTLVAVEITRNIVE